MDSLSTWLSNANTYLVALGALLTLLGVVLGKGVVRRRRVATAVKHAYAIVEDVKAECRASEKDFPYLNAAAAGLKYADEWMVTNGWRALTQGEQDRAQLEFRAIHGGQKSAAHVAAGPLVTMLAVGVLGLQLSGCSAMLHQHPRPAGAQLLPAAAVSGPIQCVAWTAAGQALEQAYLMGSAAIEQQRGAACIAPPPVPSPATSSSGQ
jgi:hypothetical protein